MDKTRRTQKFRNEYTEQFPCMKKSTKGDEYVFCTFCRQDLKIASGGANDIARHLQKQKHQENEKAGLAATKGSHKITSFVKKSDDYSVINAEVHFTDFLVEHNIALNVSDHWRIWKDSFT